MTPAEIEHEAKVEFPYAGYRPEFVELYTTLPSRRGDRAGASQTLNAATRECRHVDSGTVAGPTAPAPPVA